ncbi:MAG: NUDIX domain-containing protein [Desulfobacterales bacterium]
MNRHQKTEFEFSSGGAVIKGSKILLIKTKDLKGSSVWTLPKGKIEKGEKSEETALREVREETGYRCSIEKQLDEVKYFFRRGGVLVIKKVKWFLMKPEEKEGNPDSEVEEILWAGRKKARDLFRYKSDLKLLNKVLPE